MGKIKSSELDLDSDSEPNATAAHNGRQIIDADPTTTVATAQIQLEDPEESEAEERLFHSQMWVKGIPLHFVVDNGIQKNLISTEVIKRLELPTTPHPQPYNIGWLRQGQRIYVTQQCLIPNGIKTFKYEVLCDVVPLEVCDFILGQPYMWNHHVVYESQPRSVIATLGGQLYRIPETIAPVAVS